MRNTFDHTRTGSSAATRLPSREEAIAKVCHEANRAYCANLGDFSQVSWESAPDWQRNSIISGVKAVLSGAARTPEEQHEAWCEIKRNEGWRYGPVKDADAKTHPCLMPHAELPPEQKRKDIMFRAIIQSLTDFAAVPA